MWNFLPTELKLDHEWHHLKLSHVVMNDLVSLLTFLVISLYHCFCFVHFWNVVSCRVLCICRDEHCKTD